MKELAIGGAERLLLEIAPALEGEVSFTPAIVFDEPRTFEEEYRLAGFAPEMLHARSHADVGWVRRLRRLVRDARPDVVHVHLPYVGALGRIGLKGTGVPIVYTEHSLWSRYRPATRLANALTYRANDAVIWVSDAVRVGARLSVGSPRRGGRVIHNGVDADRVIVDASRNVPDQPIRSPAYGTVGHLRMEKGIDVLLDASALVRNRVPDASGFVVGDGELADQLEERRRRRGAPVHFLGLRSDARALIDELDVFVMPSRAEGLPVALLEAMVLRKPIVATRVGGMPEALVDGETALLVEPEDAAGLAAAIVRLMEDRPLAERLGQRAGEVVRQRFAVDEAARAYVDVYRAVLAGRRVA